MLSLQVDCFLFCMTESAAIEQYNAAAAGRHNADTYHHCSKVQCNYQLPVTLPSRLILDLFCLLSADQCKSDTHGSLIGLYLK